MKIITKYVKEIASKKMQFSLLKRVMIVTRVIFENSIKSMPFLLQHQYSKKEKYQKSKNCMQELLQHLYSKTEGRRNSKLLTSYWFSFIKNNFFMSSYWIFF